MFVHSDSEGLKIEKLEKEGEGERERESSFSSNLQGRVDERVASTRLQYNVIRRDCIKYLGVHFSQFLP